MFFLKAFGWQGRAAARPRLYFAVLIVSEIKNLIAWTAY